MSRKPEKKVFVNDRGFISLTDREFGYNQGRQDMIDFLPSEKEIEQIIQEVRKKYSIEYYADKFAKAISKRLR